MSIIYAIRNNTTGAAYVGQTEDLAQRSRDHLTALRRGKHPSRALQAAWNLTGETAFEVIQLEVVEPEDAIPAEQRHIDAMGTYNVRPAGWSPKLGIPDSEATKAAKRASWTQERRAKMGAAAGAALKAKWADPTYRARMTGKHFSEETRAKMSASHTGLQQTQAHRATESITMQARWEDHDAAGVMREHITQAWADPDKKARMAGNATGKRTPEQKARMAEAARVRWARARAQS